MELIMMDSGNSGSCFHSSSSPAAGNAEEEYDSSFNINTNNNTISTNNNSPSPALIFDPFSSNYLSTSNWPGAGNNNNMTLTPGATNPLSNNLTPMRNNPKKRSRASRRAPTTVLTTDTNNFRAMVQEFTGIPSPPFLNTTTSTITSSRFVHDHLYGARGSAAGYFHDPPPPYLRRPFAQKMLVDQSDSTQLQRLVPGAPFHLSTSTTSSNYSILQTTNSSSSLFNNIDRVGCSGIDQTTTLINDNDDRAAGVHERDEIKRIKMVDQN